MVAIEYWEHCIQHITCDILRLILKDKKMIGLTFQEFDMDRRQAQVFRQSIKNSEHLETSYEQEALAPTRERGR